MCIGPKLWSNLCAEIPCVDTDCVFAKPYKKHFSSILNNCSDIPVGWVPRGFIFIVFIFSNRYEYYR